MRVFRTKWFATFCRQEGIEVEALLEAIDRAERGLFDADLGGGLIKQRVARVNDGRSGGFRTIVAFRALDRAVFVYVFAKNVSGNIGPDDLRRLKALSKM